MFIEHHFWPVVPTPLEFEPTTVVLYKRIYFLTLAPSFPVSVIFPWKQGAVTDIFASPLVSQLQDSLTHGYLLKTN